MQLYYIWSLDLHTIIFGPYFIINFSPKFWLENPKLSLDLQLIQKLLIFNLEKKNIVTLSASNSYKTMDATSFCLIQYTLYTYPPGMTGLKVS